VAHGVFSEVAREGGSVMAGVPGRGASGLAPSTIGFGEDAEVGAEFISESGSSSRRVIRQGAGRAGGREGESCSGLGTGWPKDAVEKGAELSAWIKSAWYETVSVIEDGSGDLTSGYVGATAADKLLVLARLVMLNNRERVWMCVGFILGGPSHMLYIV
jgi:hypothetical protein